MTSTAVAEPISTAETTSVSELAAAAKSDRNRAVDFYRAIAMFAVAIGHWAAIAIGTDEAGELVSGNALEQAPGLSWFSWLLQVMPLFFVVGGFSSAMSLDSHNAKGGRPQDWVAARLRRMMAPTAALAATWAVLIGVGSALGFGSLVGTGAVAAAIPLWFLANYTIDTAIAPYVLPRFRRSPRLAAGAGIALFLALEGIRFIDTTNAVISFLPQFNWVLGWLLFQVAGFAWRDGILPTGAKLATFAASMWALALSAVLVGPYPVAMVHFPGIGDLSPTHPPSLALMLFGAAYSATALTMAPKISSFLGGTSKASKRAWSVVVASNGVAMSVYLWHFSAAVAASAVLYAAGMLPTAEIGTGAWWIQKLPLMGLASLFLVGIVAVVARVEQKALFAPRAPWNGGQASMFVFAIGLSTAVKLWSGGSAAYALAGICTSLVIWHGWIKSNPIVPGLLHLAKPRISSRHSG